MRIARRTAVEYLMAVLRAERGTHSACIVAPSSVLRRRSCGCADPEEIRSLSAHTVALATSWQTALAQQMVAVVSYPLTPDPPPRRPRSGQVLLP